MIILDTSVLIDDHLQSLPSDQEYAASILSRAELEFGVAVADDAHRDERRKRLAQLDELFDWLPFSSATTRAYGVVAKATHTHAPAQARRIDTYIAAHALELGVPLMTANTADFARVQHLITVLTYA